MKVEGKLGLSMQGVGGTIAKCQDIEQRFHWTINDSALHHWSASFIHEKFLLADDRVLYML